MPPTLLIVLALLACGRLARLITADRITEPLRDWLGGVERDQLGNKVTIARPQLDYLSECPWCASMYLSPLVAIPTVVWPHSDVLLIVLLLLAGSLVSGVLAQFEALLDASKDALDERRLRR